MIKCKPERSPGQAVFMIIVYAAVALCVGWLCCVLETYKWIFQLIFLVSLSLGIFLVYRYTMTEMIYTVGGGSFSVIRKVGSKETSVCSLDLSTAIELVPKSVYRVNVQAKKYGAVAKSFNFCQNLRPTGSYVYVSDFNGSVYAVEFEPNSPFVEAFCAEIDNSKNGKGNSTAN